MLVATKLEFQGKYKRFSQKLKDTSLGQVAKQTDNLVWTWLESENTDLIYKIVFL